MLEGRRAEKDFLLRKDDKYIAQHREISRQVMGDLDVLVKRIEGVGQAALLQQLGTVRADYDTYQKHFGAMADARVNSG